MKILDTPGLAYLRLKLTFWDETTSLLCLDWWMTCSQISALMSRKITEPTHDHGLEQMAEDSCVRKLSEWQKMGTWLKSAPETESVSSSKVHIHCSLNTVEWTIVAVATYKILNLCIVWHREKMYSSAFTEWGDIHVLKI